MTDQPVNTPSIEEWLHSDSRNRAEFKVAMYGDGIICLLMIDEKGYGWGRGAGMHAAFVGALDSDQMHSARQVSGYVAPSAEKPKVTDDKQKPEWLSPEWCTEKAAAEEQTQAEAAIKNKWGTDPNATKYHLDRAKEQRDLAAKMRELAKRRKVDEGAEHYGPCEACRAYCIEGEDHCCVGPDCLTICAQCYDAMNVSKDG